jgi:hypothetical protein
MRLFRERLLARLYEEIDLDGLEALAAPTRFRRHP